MTTDEEEHNDGGESTGDDGAMALTDAVKENTYAKERFDTMKNIDMFVKVLAGLVGVCVKNSCDVQTALRRVTIAIDIGACDSAIFPEHVPDHEVHESIESRRGPVMFSLLPLARGACLRS